MDWDFIDIFKYDTVEKELDINGQSILLEETGSNTTLPGIREDKVMDQTATCDRTDPSRRLEMLHSSLYWKPFQCATSSPSLDGMEDQDCGQHSEESESTDHGSSIDNSCKLCGKLVVDNTKSVPKSSPKDKSFRHRCDKNNHLPCPQCNKAFTRKPSLDRHLLLHTDDKPYRCTICPKAFRLSSTLSTHKKLHDQHGPGLRCETCGRTFTQPSALSSHRLLHRAVRPHCCSLCGKQFVRLHALKTHVLTHANERPFECDQCGKAFTEKHVLVRHQRTHSDERPHGCSVCAKSFKERYDLLRHSLIHSGLRPYKCSECSKTFIQSNALAKHRKCHDRERILGRHLDAVSFGLVRTETTCC